MFNFLKSKNNAKEEEFNKELEEVRKSYRKLLKTYQDNKDRFWNGYTDSFSDELDDYIVGNYK